MRAFSEHLLSYALGPELKVTDKPSIDKIPGGSWPITGASPPWWLRLPRASRSGIKPGRTKANECLKETQIPRRTFLRGCGAALALPLFDAMQASGAKSVQPPKRVAFFYTPNGVAQTAWHPAETGHNFALSRTLQPLEPLRKKISLFTNLDRVKVPGTDGHAQAGACYLSTAAPDELSPAGYPLKRTIDQVIADTAGKATPFSLRLSSHATALPTTASRFISTISLGTATAMWRVPSRIRARGFQRLFNVKEHRANSSLSRSRVGRCPRFAG
ncbi:MAG: hypothetical protein Ct9H300mP7_0250 [Verrucomicrobiota bacterium]|nr:MAG: hypothetical protein Ct9H300mP7_0250 [Verrucomicrobiota bacterium]